jgi:hypothetical protein
MIPLSILLSIALPTAIAIAVMAVAWRRRSETQDPVWVGALLFAVTHASAHVALVGWPPFPPIEATQWLLVLALGAGVTSAAASARRDVGRAQWSTRALFAFLLPWVLLRPLVAHSWSTPQSILTIVLLGWSMLLYSWGLEVSARNNRGVAFPLALAVAAGGSAVVLLLSGSAFLAQLAGALAAALAATAGVALFRPRLSQAGGASLVLALLFVGLWINGAFYAEAHPVAIVLAALAGLVGLVSLSGAAPPGARRRALLLALLAALLGASAAFTARQTAAESTSSSYYG